MSFVWPWQQRDPESGVILDKENQVILGPYLPPDWDSGEFGPLQPVANVVTKAVKNADRILASSSKDPVDQSQSQSWWSRFTNVGAATGDFVQSTLSKVIIIVIVVAVAAIFLMSYVQAKGANLAK